MNIKFIERGDNLLELELDNKAIGNSLLEVLLRNGVDAYCYEPHPMTIGYILHIEGKGAEKELKTAVNTLGKDWVEFGKILRSGIKQKSKK